MKDVAYGLFAASPDTDAPVSISWDVSPEVLQLSLPAEQRRDFFLIFKEAITNAARYAQARHIRVGLYYAADQLHLTLEDDGVGFDTAHPPARNPTGGNGLGNMQARAGQLQGQLQLHSSPGGGTRLHLCFPLV